MTEYQKGKDSGGMESWVVKIGPYTWDLFRTSNDEWFEACDRCYETGACGDLMCWACEGRGRARIAGTRARLVLVLRARERWLTQEPTPADRDARRARMRVKAWHDEHARTGAALARVRARLRTDPVPATLRSLALTAVDEALTPAQTDLAERILAERAEGKTGFRRYRGWHA